MNENDSEKIAGMLEEKGYIKTNAPDVADIVVLNTCSVRENADDKFFGHLGRLKNYKLSKPSMIIAVCGCMMQQSQIIDRILEKHPFVDIIFGTHNIDRFPLLLDDFIGKRKLVIEVLADAALAEGLPITRAFRHRAYVTIMNGCDNFCTYCIVPMTRGREKSRQSQKILKEIESLANDSVKEIMLIGQNVDSYGLKPGGEIRFADLLSKAARIPGIERIRFMTSHPKDFSSDVIEAICANENICPSIHLPMQSGSSRILKAMNRHYDRGNYLSLVEKIRTQVKDASISTDIIVGFPGETEKDFKDTLDCIEECRFENAFTFQFSARIGTAAFDMPDQVPKDVIKERFLRLTDLVHSIMGERSQKYLGTIQKVIVDEASNTNASLMSGRTMGNKLVNFTGQCAIGQTVKVKIKNAHTFYLSGEMV